MAAVNTVWSGRAPAQLAVLLWQLSQLPVTVLGELEAEASGRVVDWRIAELPVVTGDRAMLRIALVNLISNALKFTRPRPQAEIEIGLCARQFLGMRRIPSLDRLTRQEWAWNRKLNLHRVKIDRRFTRQDPRHKFRCKSPLCTRPET